MNADDIFNFGKEVADGPKHDLFAPTPLTGFTAAQERAYYDLARVMGWPRHRAEYLSPLTCPDPVPYVGAHVDGDRWDGPSRVGRVAA